MNSSFSQLKNDPKAFWSSPEMQARLRRRHSFDRIFLNIGRSAILFSIVVLALVLISIGGKGMGAFWETQLRIEISFDEDQLGLVGGASESDLEEALLQADFGAVIRNSMRSKFPEVSARREVRELQALVSSGARKELREKLRDEPGLVGEKRTLWLVADDEVDLFYKGAGFQDGTGAGRLSEKQVEWIAALESEGLLRRNLSRNFLTSGDSREPELAGIWGAFIGSILALLVTLLVAFPMGVSAAVYLEEYAPENRLTQLIEVNVNNLAAVPSIVYGLLGLAIFLGFMNMPRSAPLVGGFTLALMTLPTIIISGRAALKAVPPSIREAAIGIGASPMQVVLHHTLPSAMPGILTGTILGMARAMGETAPLLMIGMVAFVVDIPQGLTDAATALPVQVYLWADSPERAFVEKASGAIMVLLALLIVMNGAAIWLRQKYEVKW